MADHADHLTNRTGVSIDELSHKIGDFYQFTMGKNLVLALLLIQLIDYGMEKNSLGLHR